MAVLKATRNELSEASAKHAQDMHDLRNARESKLGELTRRVEGTGRNVHQQIGCAQEREAAVAKTASIHNEFVAVHGARKLRPTEDWAWALHGALRCPVMPAGGAKALRAVDERDLAACEGLGECRLPGRALAVESAASERAGE